MSFGELVISWGEIEMSLGITQPQNSMSQEVKWLWCVDVTARIQSILKANLESDLSSWALILDRISSWCINSIKLIIINFNTRSKLTFQCHTIIYLVISQKWLQNVDYFGGP